MASKKTNGTTTALAKVPEATEEFAALSRPDFVSGLREVLEENLGAEIAPFDFEEVKMPSGGGLSWTVQTLEGPEPAKTVTGVIVHVDGVREYYQGDFDGVSRPPDCFSPDLVSGYGNPGGACLNCPLSEFGGDCMERRHMLVLPTDNLLPLFFNLPRTSIRALRDYGRLLTGKGLTRGRVVTEIGLEVASSNEGIKYSKATFAFKGVLPAEQAAQAAAYGQALAALIRTKTADEARRRVASEPKDVTPQDDDE
jgi:hypothetical protein